MDGPQYYKMAWETKSFRLHHTENHANVVFYVRVKVVGMAWTPDKAQQIHGNQTTLYNVIEEAYQNGRWWKEAVEEQQIVLSFSFQPAAADQTIRRGAHWSSDDVILHKWFMDLVKVSFD